MNLSSSLAGVLLSFWVILSPAVFADCGTAAGASCTLYPQLVSVSQKGRGYAVTTLPLGSMAPGLPDTLVRQ